MSGLFAVFNWELIYKRNGSTKRDALLNFIFVMGIAIRLGLTLPSSTMADNNSPLDFVKYSGFDLLGLINFFSLIVGSRCSHCEARH